MVCRHPVAAQKSEIFDICSGLALLAVNSIHKRYRPRVSPRHSKAQSKRLSCGGPAIALGARQLWHSGIEQPWPLCAQSLTILRVRWRKVPIRNTFLKDGVRHLPMQSEAFGLFVFFVPAQVQPLQSFKDRLHRGFRIPLHVRVVEAQDHCSAVVARVKPVKNEGTRTSNVEKSRG